MSILFVNGSPNKIGNTARLAEQFLMGKEYTMKRFASISGMEYGGMITNKKEADLLAERLG